MKGTMFYFGNITTLQRYGRTGASTYGRIDYLTLTYSGNRLSTVKDTGSAAYSTDFRFSNTTSTTYSYTYDAAGRMTKDAAKGISSITWNVLGLPQTVTFSNGNVINYSYAADGTKLRESKTASGTTTTTDYTGTLVLEDGTRSRMLFDGGYISMSDNAYHFFITDHLGSVRVVANSNGVAEEYNHYYPLGGLLPTSTSSTGIQPLKYQGKEWAGAKGLNLYDFGARRYDPATGRWLSPDPLSEKYYGHSPYLFCAANPMRYVDPEGKKLRIIIGEKESRQQLKYENERLYYMNGKEYGGSDSFALNVLSSLNTLKGMGNADIQRVLSTLESSEQKHYIEYYPYSDKDDHVAPVSEFGYSLANSGVPVDTHIYLKLTGEPIEKNLPVTRESTLGHELKHAYDFDRGKYKGLFPWKSNTEIDPKEISAVVFENKIRTIQGLPMRTSYEDPIRPELLSHPVVY